VLLSAMTLYFALRLCLMGRLVGPLPEALNNPAIQATMPGRVLLGLSLVYRSVSLMLVPLELSAEYGAGAIIIPTSFFSFEVIMGAVVLLALGLLFFWARGRQVLLATGSAFLGSGLILLSNVPTVLPTIFAERLLYWPSLGWVMIVAGVVPLASTVALKRIAVILVMVLAIFQFVLTVDRNRDWVDGVTIFSRAVEVNPRSVRARLNLGLALNKQGRHAEALPQLNAARKLWPDLLIAEMEMAIAYDLLGQKQQAASFFERLYRAHPQDAGLRWNFYQFLRRHGRLEEARRLLPQAGPRPGARKREERQ
jgi:protein O-mannosyl-transferase